MPTFSCGDMPSKLKALNVATGPLPTATACPATGALNPARFSTTFVGQGLLTALQNDSNHQRTCPDPRTSSGHAFQPQGRRLPPALPPLSSEERLVQGLPATCLSGASELAQEQCKTITNAIEMPHTVQAFFSSMSQVSATASRRRGPATSRKKLSILPASRGMRT